MVSNARDGHNQPVRDLEAAEARAYHTVAEMVFGKPSLAADRRVIGQLSQLMHAVGTELEHGRAVPPPVRRATRGLAAALRDVVEPRTGMAARASATPADPGPGDARTVVFRAAH